MNGEATGYPWLILIVGLTMLATLALRRLGRELGIPAMVAYVAVGLGLNALDRYGVAFPTPVHTGLEFLASAGIIALLFRVGLQSNLPELIGQLRRASLVWAGDVTVSGALGFATAYYLLGLNLIPSLFAAAALTATSIGISTTIWREENKLDTKAGALLVDVAELDDISGILLMTVLFVIAPQLQFGGQGAAFSGLGDTLFWLAVKFSALVALCFLFSQYLERPLTNAVLNGHSDAPPVLWVVGLSFSIAAIAEFLGFSFAIGAIFAGFAFSRDPEEGRIDRLFNPLYQFLSPFFFIGIGLMVDFASLGSGMMLGLALLVVAVAGKVLGGGLPALSLAGGPCALLIGASLIPRAEIAMVIMAHGRAFGSWAVPDALFGAMVVVSLGTSLLAPIAVRMLLRGLPLT